LVITTHGVPVGVGVGLGEGDGVPVGVGVGVNVAVAVGVGVGVNVAVGVGVGLRAPIVNICALDVPPPGAGFTTVTEAVPGEATRAAVTVAVSCVEDTNVVVSVVPFQFTVELETKLVPFTVIVN
jgi:hypothetical protein